ncbi:MAG: hypothetical protein LBT50_06875 [Prevotellaceae bacterium]|nr:hypothetical protein [Prevotellaceae bacterium]
MTELDLTGRSLFLIPELEYTFPATSPPAGDDLVNIYQVTPVNQSSSFMFALPREYPYLKFKVYISGSNSNF